VADRQEQQFQRRLVIGEAAAGLDDLAQRAMQALHRVCGVNHLADRRREGKQRYDVVPGAPPGLADRRVALAPSRLEIVELGGGGFSGFGPINRL
jgi:hypothetical protein